MCVYGVRARWDNDSLLFFLERTDHLHSGPCLQHERGSLVVFLRDHPHRNLKSTLLLGSPLVSRSPFVLSSQPIPGSHDPVIVGFFSDPEKPGVRHMSQRRDSLNGRLSWHPSPSKSSENARTGH